MRVFSEPEEIPGDVRSAVTIGKFDGVHAGHRAVLAQLGRIANDRGLVPTVVTFDRHPLSLLRPKDCPNALVSNSQKLRLLEAAGVELTLMLEFNELLASREPDEFVRSILVDALHARVVLIGRDFRFGAHGRGTVDTLRILGEDYGFEVHLIDDVVDEGGRRASSTLIRTLLDAGDVREAAELLGYLPTVRGMVVHGMARGRALGFPTANLERNSDGLIPADGVYAGWLDVDGVRYPAAVSIGNNPTFDGVRDKTVEAHVLDEDIDLYDRIVAVSFVDYIRPMLKFETMNELTDRIARDLVDVRTILATSESSPAAP